MSFRISSLPMKFWDEFYKTVVYSPAFYPLPFLSVHNAENSEDLVEEIPVNSKRLSKNVPLLPYYLQKFTVSVDNPGKFELIIHFFLVGDIHHFGLMLLLLQRR